MIVDDESANIYDRIYNQNLPQSSDYNQDEIPDKFQERVVNTKKETVSTDIMKSNQTVSYKIGKQKNNQDTLFFMLVTENENPERITIETKNFDYDYDLLNEYNMFKKENKLVFNVNRIIDISESDKIKVSFDGISRYTFTDDVSGYLYGEYIE